MSRIARRQSARPGLIAAGLLAVLLLLAYVAVQRGLTHSLIKPTAVPAASTVHFQYQDLDLQRLRQLPVDVLVIDPDDLDLSPTEVNLLKQGIGGQPRLVLAYLSVGEAEEYRDYWQVNWRPGSPDFIAEANSNWSGNYLVRYWDRRWRRTMEQEAARLADLGFDGAYLDTVDSYQAWEERGEAGAADRMINLVRAVRVSARRQNSDFLIVPQNAPELYAERAWRGLVDGLGKEETWYLDGHRRQPAETVDDIRWLDQAKSDGKLVLALDYPTEASDICDFYRLCQAKGYACAVGNLALNRSEPAACGGSD